MSFTLSMAPLLQPLLGNVEILELFSASQEIAALLAFEVELARAQEKCSVIPKGTAQRIEKTIESLELDQQALHEGIARDGVVVPALVRQIKGAVKPSDAEHVHKFATSQDAIDTSFMMRAAISFEGIQGDIGTIADKLQKLRKSYGTRKLMGRTRMQQALPITVGDRLDSWVNNIGTSAVQIAQVVFPLQLSGPVGTYADNKVKKALAGALGLTALEHSWQNERGPMLYIGNACAGVTGALGKLGADIALMAQNEIAEIRLKDGGASSAMPHKQNPVKAETLVTLARFNAALLSALHNAAVHEQERSGSAWTLEWMVLPQMINSAAAATRLCQSLFDSIESLA